LPMVLFKAFVQPRKKRSLRSFNQLFSVHSIAFNSRPTNSSFKRGKKKERKKKNHKSTARSSKVNSPIFLGAALQDLRADETIVGDRDVK